jgi:hypothetical protein
MQFGIAIKGPGARYWQVASHRPWGHLDAPYYILLGIIHTKKNKARLKDSTADGYRQVAVL